MWVMPFSPQSSSSSRPIELQAHDPLRYAGDMLAWIHQAVAQEREHLEAVLPTGEHSDPPVADEGRASTGRGPRNAHTLVQDMADRCFRGICTSLQKRIESLYQKSQVDTIVLYRVSTLLEFYSETLSSILGPHKQLSKTLWRYV